MQTFLSLRKKRRWVADVLLVFILIMGQISVPAKAASFLAGYVFDFTAGLALGGPADAAQAAIDSVCPGVCHPCNRPECTISSTALSFGARMSINVAIKALQTLINFYLGQVKGAMTKLANQGSNDLQNITNSLAATNDAVAASSVADTIAGARTVNTVRLVPSTSACRIASRDRSLMDADTMMRVGIGGIGSGPLYAQSQRTGTDYAANLPGGPTEKGALQAVTNSFDEAMNGFCDNALVNAPAGVSCTLVNDRDGQPMSFRFSQPYAVVFGAKDDYIPSAAADPENRAARLFVRYAIEPVPTDPVRGQALVRAEGRSTFITRQSDVAAMNLARGALDRTVDDRMENPSLGTSPSGKPQSLQSVRMLAWADFGTAYEDAKRRASQPLGSNYDDLGPLVGDVNKIYLQLYNNLERLAAIKATRLARLIKQNSAGGAGVGARTIQN